MHPLFIATGPEFKEHLRLDKTEIIENIDLYPLIQSILHVNPFQGTFDGDFRRIRKILKDERNYFM
jgi:hypothetical protein